MSTADGLLRVHASKEGEVEASRARVHVTLEGTTFLIGNAALTRSQEIKALLQALTAAGVPSDGTAVAAVQAVSEGKLLGRATRACYSLVLPVASPEQVGEAIQVITNQKNIRLDHLEWIYDEEPVLARLAAEALALALRKGEAMAQAVGQQVIGIRACSDSEEAPVHQHDIAFGGAPHGPAAKRSRGGDDGGGGLSFRGKRALSVTVTADLVIRARTAAAGG